MIEQVYIIYAVFLAHMGVQRCQLYPIPIEDLRMMP